MTDEYWMGLALSEARYTLGRTWPNPPVGAVLVRDGRCLARGSTQTIGMNHAERECLAEAGDLAAGAVLYVTLEPCSHHGRTPPCTDALIAAGVSRVVVAAGDPNPLVAGRGLAILRQAGIQVDTGCREHEAIAIMQPFFRYILSNKPFITLKYAMTLDGRMALDSGDSVWITGVEARNEVQSLRREAQAILVGGNTVRTDNPRLDCRIAGPDWQPARIIVTKQGIPLDARIFDSGGPVYLLMPEDAAQAEQARMGAKASVHGLASLDASQVAAWLGAHGFASVLLEGGPSLITGFVRERLVNRVLAYLAPLMAGGTLMQPISEIGTKFMRDAPRLRGVWRQVGSDVCFDGSFEDAVDL